MTNKEFLSILTNISRDYFNNILNKREVLQKKHSQELSDYIKHFKAPKRTDNVAAKFWIHFKIQCDLLLLMLLTMLYGDGATS